MSQNPRIDTNSAESKIRCKFCDTVHSDPSHWFRCDETPYDLSHYILGEYGLFEVVMAYMVAPIVFGAIVLVSIVDGFPPSWYWLVWGACLEGYVAILVKLRTEWIERWHIREEAPLGYVGEAA